MSGKVITGNFFFQYLKKRLVKTEADLKAEQARTEAITYQLEEIGSELRSLELTERKLQNLKRDSTIQEKNYLIYREKVEEARIHDEMNRKQLDNVIIIESATLPTKPIKPKTTLNIALGILLGATSGLGFAFLRDYMSQTFATPHSAEKRLGVPVLTTINLKNYCNVSTFRRVVWVSITMLLIFCGVGGVFIFISQSQFDLPKNLASVRRVVQPNEYEQTVTDKSSNEIPVIKEEHSSATSVPDKFNTIVTPDDESQRQIVLEQKPNSSIIKISRLEDRAGYIQNSGN